MNYFFYITVDSEFTIKTRFGDTIAKNATASNMIGTDDAEGGSSSPIVYIVILCIGLTVPAVIVFMSVILLRSNKSLFTRFKGNSDDIDDTEEMNITTPNFTMHNILNADECPGPIKEKALDRLGVSMVYMGSERLML